MIAELRAAQLRSPGEFAEGLAEWFGGDDSLNGEAAAAILAETVLMHRLWLKSKFKK